MDRSKLQLVTIIWCCTACAPLRFPELHGDASTSDAFDAGVSSDGELDGATDAAEIALDVDGGFDAGPEPHDGTVTNPDSATLSTLSVRSGDVPVEGIEVILHAANGRVLGSTVTDARGDVTAELGPQGMFSIVRRIDHGDVQLTLETIQEVNPGDHITIRHPDTRIATEAVGVGPGPYPEATSYEFRLGCSTVGYSFDPRSVAATMSVECFNFRATNDAVMVAKSSAQEVLAFAIVPDVQVATATTTFVYFPEWRTDYSSFTVEVTEAPWNAGEIRTTYEPYGHTNAWDLEQVQTSTNAGASRFVFQSIPEVTRTHHLRVAWNFEDEPDSEASLVLPTAGTSTSVTIPATQMAFGPIRFDGLDQSVPARPEIRWSADRFGTLSIVLLGYQRGHDGLLWSLYAPASSGSVRFPALPDEFAAKRPRAEDVLGISIFLLQSDVLPSYRACVEAFAGITFGSGSVMRAPAQGRFLSYQR